MLIFFIKFLDVIPENCGLCSLLSNSMIIIITRLVFTAVVDTIYLPLMYVWSTLSFAGANFSILRGWHHHHLHYFATYFSLILGIQCLLYLIVTKPTILLLLLVRQLPCNIKLIIVLMTCSCFSYSCFVVI